MLKGKEKIKRKIAAEEAASNERAKSTLLNNPRLSGFTSTIMNEEVLKNLYIIRLWFSRRQEHLQELLVNYS